MVSISFKCIALCLVSVPLFTSAFIAPSTNLNVKQTFRRINNIKMMAEDGKPVIIGTRGSPLALAQAYETKRRLGEAFPDELAEEGAVEIKIIKTTGDMILDKALSEIGGKGLFTKELDVSLLSKEVDICVHSMKDVPTWLPEGTILPCNLPREDTRDVFISNKADRLEDLPDGSVIGSASLRRQAQILAKNPTLKVVNFRGNVQSRLRKLGENIVDATLLARAGLNRMDMEECITQTLEWDQMLPAVAQGAIGIQCRSDDERAKRFIGALNCENTKICVDTERSFLATLDGNCKTPIAGQAKIVDGKIHFRGILAMPDGSEFYETERVGELNEGEKLGREAGEELKERAGDKFFECLYGQAQGNETQKDDNKVNA
jgi:hydroxymethylbilane synthase